jgi:hypothetical protein
MVHRWWFHKGPPHDREHHHFPTLIARLHETSGHELPPMFLSKKGHVQEPPQKERKPPKKNHEKKI